MQKVPIFTDTLLTDLEVHIAGGVTWMYKHPKCFSKNKNSFLTYKSFGWRISLSSTLSKPKEKKLGSTIASDDRLPRPATTTTKGPRMHLF
jgi:hypothetical protein